MSVQQQIHDKLVDALGPTALEVINESHRHSGPATESHFKVVVVSARFEGVPLLRRHRLVNETLADELSSGVHALSIVAYTPAQWVERGGEVPASPPCRG
ncbi:MAG: BolA/IbaG family iron-sulfur metabolism protein, partial [Myxococcales bacterium]|nr:BolA/IbaG family iron-sulfur metabolism protein [Myxococcales bacterium]